MHHKHCENFAVPSCCKKCPWLSQANKLSHKLHDEKLKTEQEDSTVAAWRLGASRAGVQVKGEGEGQTEKKSCTGGKDACASQDAFQDCYNICSVLSNSHITTFLCTCCLSLCLFCTPNAELAPCLCQHDHAVYTSRQQWPGSWYRCIKALLTLQLCLCSQGVCAWQLPKQVQEEKQRQTV